MSEANSQSATTRILQACRKEIALNGVRGLRVQEVAKRAGTSLGLVYYHFHDRAGLLNATLDSVNQAAHGRGVSAGPHENPRAALERALLSELSADPENRDDAVVWNEIRAISVFEAELQPALATTTDQWHATLQLHLEAAHVPAATREATAMLLTTLVEGLSSRWLSGQINAETAQSLMRIGIQALVGEQRLNLQSANPPSTSPEHQEEAS